MLQKHKYEYYPIQFNAWIWHGKLEMACKAYENKFQELLLFLLIKYLKSLSFGVLWHFKWFPARFKPSLFDLLSRFLYNEFSHFWQKNLAKTIFCRIKIFKMMYIWTYNVLFYVWTTVVHQKLKSKSKQRNFGVGSIWPIFSKLRCKTYTADEG